MIKWMPSDRGSYADSEPDIDWVAAELGVQMPATLLELAIDFHAGHPEVRDVIIETPKGEMEAELQYLHSWLREGPVSVVSTYQDLRCLPHMDWPFLLVPFASDAAGDEFCLDFAADEHNPPVVCFAHECPWEHCFYRLAESFDAVLEAYARGCITAEFGLAPQGERIPESPREY